MAIFNPSVKPSQDPNYLGYSRGINVPETIRPQGQKGNEILPRGATYEGAKYEGNKHVDESGLYAGRAEGLASEGLGSTIKNFASVADLAVKATDAVIKEDIHQGVYDSASAERDAYLTSLQQTYNSAKAGTKQPDQTEGPDGANMPTKAANAQGTLDIITQEDTENMPDEVQGVGTAVERLDAARANGKISPTDYLGRLNTLAKSFRAKYPGYKSYIDQEISRVTGVDPANAQIKSLIQDINSFASAKSAEKLGAISFLKQHAIQHPAIAATLQGVVDGRIAPDKAMSATMPIIAELARYNYNAKVLANEEKETKQKAVDAGTLITTHVQTSSIADVDNMRVTNELDKPERMTDFINRAREGKLAPNKEGETGVTSTQWLQMRDLAVARRDAWIAATKRDFAKPLNARGDTIASLHGQEETDKKIASGAAWHNMIIDGLGKQDAGLVGAAMTMSKAQSDDMVVRVMGDPKLGGVFRLLDGFSRANPEIATRMFDTILGSEDLPPPDKTALIAKLAKIMKQPTMDPRRAPISGPAQPGVTTGNTPAGVPYTINQAIDDAVATGGQKAQIKKIIEAPQIITDPSVKDDTVKYNTALATFDPRNAGLVSKFDTDRINRSTGRVIPGQQTIYGTLVNEGMSAEVKRLSVANNDPKLWTNYSRFARDEFANGPLAADINNLKDVKLPPGYRMAWRPDTHALGVVNERGLDVLNFKGRLSPLARNTILSINSGLGNLSSVAKQDGGSMDAYLLGTLINYGFDPRSIAIPESIMKAIINSRKKVTP